MFALAVLLVQSPKPVVDLPFEHDPGRIWLRATLNGNPAHAILDSGAFGICAFEDPAARARGTKGDAFSVTGIGETPGTGWHTKDLRFGLEGTDVAAPVPYILAPFRPLSGRRPVEAVAGFDFFLRYAVEIDYANRRLRLHRPWTYRPPADYIPLRLRFSERRPIVEADVELPGMPARRVSILLDTGAPNGLEISRRMAVREGLDERFKDVPTEDAPGGMSGPTRVRRIAHLRYRLAGVDLDSSATVSMTEGGLNGAKVDHDVLMGDAALRRFDVVFDYWHGRVYLRPNGR